MFSDRLEKALDKHWQKRATKYCVLLPITIKPPSCLLVQDRQATELCYPHFALRFEYFRTLLQVASMPHNRFLNTVWSWK